MVVLLIVGAIFLALFMYVFYVHYYWPYYSFTKICNLKGPTPIPFFGNYFSFLKYDTLYDCQKAWAKKYGNTFLYFIGIQPNVFTSDIDATVEMLKTKASCFVERPNYRQFISGDGSMTGALVMVRGGDGGDWRRLRRTIAPSFTIKKIRAIAPTFDPCCKTLVKRLVEQGDANGVVEVSECFGSYVLEAVLLSMFGIQADAYDEQGTQIRKAITKIFTNQIDNTIKTEELLIVMWSHSITFIQLVAGLAKYTSLGECFLYLSKISKQLTEDRRKSSVKRNDFLQSLIDARDETAGPTDAKRKLTDQEISNNILMFAFGGYFTTKLAMGFWAFHLASNPEYQDKAIKMIQEYFKDNPDATIHDASESINYLEAILMESSRLYPVANCLPRQCIETCTIQGSVIPKGTVIQMSMTSIHRNPKIWADPDKFNPDRFSSDLKISQCSHLGFGDGPRNCVAKSLAISMQKMAMLACLKDYRFEVVDKTENPPQLTENDGTLLLVPKSGIYLKVVPLQP